MVIRLHSDVCGVQVERSDFALLVHQCHDRHLVMHQNTIPQVFE
jgi:hypothetical protein